MGRVTRKHTKTDTLELLPCPDCQGDITAGDCGYSSFNPGWAKCSGCGREWDLGYVNNAWDAGEYWNAEQPKSKRRDALMQEMESLDNELP